MPRSTDPPLSRCSQGFAVAILRSGRKRRQLPSRHSVPVGDSGTASWNSWRHNDRDGVIAPDPVPGPSYADVASGGDAGASAGFAAVAGAFLSTIAGFAAFAGSASNAFGAGSASDPITIRPFSFAPADYARVATPVLDEVDKLE